jgi:hypothetical protein
MANKMQSMSKAVGKTTGKKAAKEMGRMEHEAKGKKKPKRK